MKYFILLCLGSMLFFGCSKPETKVVNRVEYQLYRKESVDKNGIVNVALYIKKGDTNKFYTPSLIGNDMIPLMK